MGPKMNKIPLISFESFIWGSIFCGSNCKNANCFLKLTFLGMNWLPWNENWYISKTLKLEVKSKKSNNNKSVHVAIISWNCLILIRSVSKCKLSKLFPSSSKFSSRYVFSLREIVRGWGHPPHPDFFFFWVGFDIYLWRCAHFKISQFYLSLVSNKIIPKNRSPYFASMWRRTKMLPIEIFF